MVANLALFSEIANQFADIRFGRYSKSARNFNGAFTKCNDLLVYKYASGGRKVHKSMLILCFLVVFYFK